MTLSRRNVSTMDHTKYVELSREAEPQVPRNPPLTGLSTLSYTIVRNRRVDLGHPVERGCARWRLHRATKA